MVCSIASAPCPMWVPGYQLPWWAQRAGPIYSALRVRCRPRWCGTNIALEVSPRAEAPDVARNGTGPSAGASPMDSASARERWPRPAERSGDRCRTTEASSAAIALSSTSAKRSAASLPDWRGSAGRTRIESMIDYRRRRPGVSIRCATPYGARDTILHALGVGFAADPLGVEELRFVYEKELQAAPTMAASCIAWLLDAIAANSASTTEARTRRTGRRSIRRCPQPARRSARSRASPHRRQRARQGATMHVRRPSPTKRADGPVATAEMVASVRGDGGL